jgi:hypothetical protein
MIEGVRFNDEMQKLPTGKIGYMPKGVFRYKTHEAANEHQYACLVARMAQIALDRGRA